MFAIRRYEGYQTKHGGRPLSHMVQRGDPKHGEHAFWECTEMGGRGGAMGGVEGQVVGAIQTLQKNCDMCEPMLKTYKQDLLKTSHNTK